MEPERTRVSLFTRHAGGSQEARRGPCAGRRRSLGRRMDARSARQKAPRVWAKRFASDGGLICGCRYKGGKTNDQTIRRFRAVLFSQARFRRCNFQTSKGTWPWRAHDGGRKAAPGGRRPWRVFLSPAASGPWQKAAFLWSHASAQAAAQADVWEAGRVLPVAGAGRDVSGGACADVDSGIMPVCRGRFLTEASAGTAFRLGLTGEAFPRSSGPLMQRPLTLARYGGGCRVPA